MIWFFLIVVTICVTIVACVCIYNAEKLNFYVVRSDINKIYNRLKNIDERLDELKAGVKNE